MWCLLTMLAQSPFVWNLDPSMWIALAGLIC
jgi:hypothetical protein